MRDLFSTLILIFTTTMAVDAQVQWSLAVSNKSEKDYDDWSCHTVWLMDQTRGLSRYRLEVLSYLKFATAFHFLMTHDEKKFVKPHNYFCACLSWLADNGNVLF